MQRFIVGALLGVIFLQALYAVDKANQAAYWHNMANHWHSVAGPILRPEDRLDPETVVLVPRHDETGHD